MEQYGRCLQGFFPSTPTQYIEKNPRAFNPKHLEASQIKRVLHDFLNNPSQVHKTHGSTNPTAIKKTSTSHMIHLKLSHGPWQKQQREKTGWHLCYRFFQWVLFFFAFFGHAKTKSPRNSCKRSSVIIPWPESSMVPERPIRWKLNSSPFAPENWSKPEKESRIIFQLPFPSFFRVCARFPCRLFSEDLRSIFWSAWWLAAWTSRVHSQEHPKLSIAD